MGGEGLRPDVLTSPMCLFIICMMAGRRAGPGFFSGLGKGFLFVSNLPTMSPFSREMVRGEARAPHLVLHGIHAVVFLMRCSLFFFSAGVLSLFYAVFCFFLQNILV